MFTCEFTIHVNNNEITYSVLAPWKLMMVVGGQAPKAIRSVECYDFKEERWHQVAELPSRRCRAGTYLIL